MVQRKLKIPRHGGPDGQGLPQAVFDELIKIFSDPSVTDQDAEATLQLSFAVSRQQEWNDIYRPRLLEYIDTDRK